MSPLWLAKFYEVLLALQPGNIMLLKFQDLKTSISQDRKTLIYHDLKTSISQNLRISRAQALKMKKANDNFGYTIINNLTILNSQKLINFLRKKLQKWINPQDPSYCIILIYEVSHFLLLSTLSSIFSNKGMASVQVLHKHVKGGWGWRKLMGCLTRNAHSA